MFYGHLSTCPNLPFVIRPENEAESELKYLSGWLNSDRQFVADQLLRFGAVLFRGFAVRSDEEFEVIATQQLPALKNYVEGNSPRTAISAKVYTSTDYPESEFITLHNELSYRQSPPAQLLFFCHTAAKTGGETPLADCRRILQMLPVHIRQQFSDLGVCYIQNMHDGHGLGRSWQQTFETSQREVVENWLRQGNVDFEWKTDGGLWTCQVRPAIIAHPISGDLVWFNQAEQWHITSLNDKAQAAIRAAYEPDEYPLHALYGDGSDIDEKDLATIRQLFRQHMVAFPWQPGDVLIVDNYRVAHGRNPFLGPRAIRVAMG